MRGGNRQDLHQDRGIATRSNIVLNLKVVLHHGGRNPEGLFKNYIVLLTRQERRLGTLPAINPIQLKKKVACRKGPLSSEVAVIGTALIQHNGVMALFLGGNGRRWSGIRYFLGGNGRRWSGIRYCRSFEGVLKWFFRSCLKLYAQSVVQWQAANELCLGEGNGGADGQGSVEVIWNAKYREVWLHVADTTRLGTGY